MDATARIEHLETEAFTIPTEEPESDGTAEWSATTLVLARLEAGGATGWGWTYGHECCAPLMRRTLFPIVRGRSAFDIPGVWRDMRAAVRNIGRRGVASCAMAALDAALWDLKARLLAVSFVKLLGAARKEIPIYGSGGFTSYSDEKLCHQLAGWANDGISMVKMKIGREPERDPARVAAARRAIGEKTQLFVDANGAYGAQQARGMARRFAEEGVNWFEEPVSSDDLRGLRFVREDCAMDVAAGEYNYDTLQARAMLEAGAVDVLQADATRCGVTGFLETAALCEAFGVPLSCHTAPALHGHLACVTGRTRHVEYFFDHARIEQSLFEGATAEHENGILRPDPAQPGFGLAFKAKDAAKFRVDV